MVLLFGCGPTDLELRLADYRGAVQDVVGVEEPSVESVPSDLRLPGRRDRRVDVADRRIGGFDFLAIQSCRLSEIVGRRNSPMGRVMVSSRLLIHELELLEAADACVAELEPERGERFRRLLGGKRAEVPSHVWNAVWMGEEMEEYLSPSWRAFSSAAAPGDPGALQALVRVAGRPIRGATDAVDLEGALEGLRSEFPAGATLRLVDRTRLELDAVSALLEPRWHSSCRGDEVRLTRIFEQRYLPLQRELAALDRHARPTVEALDALFTASGLEVAEVPEAMRTYHRQNLSTSEPEGVWLRYRHALRRHAKAWEPTLSRCGLLPKPPAA